MRIVYTVLDGRMSGGQVICGHLMAAAVSAGHQVCLITPSLGEFTEQVKSRSIEVVQMPMERTFFFHRSVSFAKFLRDWDADLVHCHSAVAGTILARIGAYLAGVPLISHVHIENKFSDVRWIQKLQIILDNITAIVADKIITISNATKSSLIDQGISSNKITVIHNGISLTEHFDDMPEIDQLRSTLGLQKNSHIVGTVARLCPVKGQREFILAARNICNLYPNTEFLVIGEDYEFEGKYRSNLENLVKELDLEEFVHFLGFRSDVRRLIYCFEIFVLPSWIEGLPVTILEAMAARKPVVATSVGGVPELVLDGETGILVPPRDVPGLSKAIELLLEQPDIGHQMGNKGYEYIHQEFSHEKMWTQVQQLYKSYE
jgi:glycosyltransferase involved in cell wall biosynthesis